MCRGEDRTIRWTLTIAFLAVAAYCVVRLAKARHVPTLYRGCHRVVDVGHGVMSAGMGVMCSPVGGPVPVAGWQTVFLLTTAWFLGSWWRQTYSRTAMVPIGWHGGCLHHAVAGLAMFYMLTAMPTGHHAAAPWVPAMPDNHLALPLVSWLFAGYFLLHATVLGPRLVRPVPAGDTRLPAILTASRLAAACQVFMALGMTYMLVA